MRQHGYFMTLADYHIWATARLLKALEPMRDTDYNADQGLFFHSVHHTLNHLLLVDLLWHGRLTGKPFAITGLDQELVKERDKLVREMVIAAETLKQLVTGLDDAKLEASRAYVDTEGNRREYPLCLQLAHIFNHATHHRGQVTSVITRLGLESPVLDLPYSLDEVMAH